MEEWREIKDKRKIWQEGGREGRRLGEEMEGGREGSLPETPVARPPTLPSSSSYTLPLLSPSLSLLLAMVLLLLLLLQSLHNHHCFNVSFRKCFRVHKE